MDYKEKQKMYKKMYKERGKFVWISKEKGDIKGRTFVKKEQEKEVTKKQEEVNNG